MVGSVLRWSEFAAANPELAAVGRAMLYDVGIGLGFLATVRPDGGPRVHPICPLIADDLYGFIVDGPKLADLRRDGRYALHSETFGPPRHDDAFYVTGTIRELDAGGVRDRLTQQFLDEREMTEPWPDFEHQALVEFTMDRVLLTLTEAGGSFPAGHSTWSDERRGGRRGSPNVT